MLALSVKRPSSGPTLMIDPGWTGGGGVPVEEFELLFKTNVPLPLALVVSCPIETPSTTTLNELFAAAPLMFTRRTADRTVQPSVD